MTITMDSKLELKGKDYLAYRAGALLYSPAINTKIAQKILSHAFGKLPAFAFCLEDSIMNEALRLAETNLKLALQAIRSGKSGNLPLLFVRVRTPEHLVRVHSLLQEDESVLTGYILPKFDLNNAKEYTSFFADVNKGREKPLYFMPILESSQIADICTRQETLYAIKNILSDIQQYVLGIRVGGNDLCNLYGLRRSVGQTIYDIAVVRNILADIINVFSRDYVVSGPVWEYYGTDVSGAWADGLRAEIALDRLNGFIGKTVIHPSQIQIILDSLSVSRRDYEDAKKLLNWDDKDFGVAKSVSGERMNEVKCHVNWAKKIMALADVYGIKDE